VHTWPRHGAILSLALFLALASANAAASPAAPDAEDPFFAEVDEVLSATRLAQRPQDAPAAVFIIDREMIETSGAREIADLLRLAPGFIVATDVGGRRAVGYRGFVDSYGRRLQVLIDGRSVYMPFNGGTTWTDLPVALDDIERIEVIRGPNGASHGANAFQGVVSIVTRHPEASQGLYLHAAAGEPKYRKGLFRQGFSTGPAEVRYTLGHKEDSGYEVFLDDLVDGKELGLATFDMAIGVSPRDRVRFQAGIKRGDLRDGGNDIENGNRIVGPTIENPPRTIEMEHLFGQVNWEHQRDDGDLFKLLAYVQQLEHQDDFPTVVGPGDPDHPCFGIPIGACPLPFDISVDLSRSRNERRYALELQHIFEPWSHLRVAWGGEVRRDEVDSRALLGPGSPVDNTLLRLFGNAEWRVTPEVVVNVGAMFEEHDLFEDAISPRLALNYSPNREHTFRIAGSRSVRTPSIWEGKADEFYPLDLDFGTGFDGEIDAIYQHILSDFVPDNETVDALELGWLFDLSAKTGVRGDVKLFYERYRGMLASYPYGYLGRDDLGACSLTGGFCDNLNEGSSKLDEPNPMTEGAANQFDLDFYGVEASLELRPSNRSRVIGSYTLNRTRNIRASNPALLDYDFNDGRSDATLLAKETREWGQSYPSHIFSLLGILRATPNLTFSAAIYHLSNTQFLEVGDNLPAYTRLDLRTAYRFRLNENWQAELYGVVQNTGGDYSDFQGKTLFETRAFAGIKIYQ
jgi:iron complex outermembrane receptor protein